MPGTVTETFFLPDEVDRKSWSVPGDIYNLYRSLLGRGAVANVFVPIRSMQFLAILDQNEIVFVDSQSYAVHNNEGGRLILIAWQFSSSHDRDALTDPMPCSVVFYAQKNSDIQLRLINEFRQSMKLMDGRYRTQALPGNSAKILQLKKTM